MAPDYAAAARALNCDVAAIKAVADVESAGAGMNPDGRPKILFEAHIFHARTGGRFATQRPDLSSKKWNRSLYAKTQDGEWQRYQQAAALDAKAAMQSTSWGRFQIMGFNHAACGYPTVEAFVAAMMAGEDAQLQAFVGFLKTNKLDAPLRAHDWPAFAKGYNGPAYAQNRYDVKMAAAWAKHSKG